MTELIPKLAVEIAIQSDEASALEFLIGRLSGQVPVEKSVLLQPIHLSIIDRGGAR